MYNSRIRKITVSTGIITTVAGRGSGDPNTAEDNVAATSTILEYPLDVAFDTYGNMFIADLRRVRKVTASTGIITTFAGNRVYRTSAVLGVAATSSNFNSLKSITVDTSGNVFITDTYFNSI